MPKRDIYHDIVVNALVKDGWVITDDPLFLSYGGRDVYIDLGADKTIGAQKDNQKIAVEIKSFLSASVIYDLELSIGQYNLYRDILSEVEPERVLYLAISTTVYKGIFNDSLGRLVLERQRLKLIVFDEAQETIFKWVI